VIDVVSARSPHRYESQLRRRGNHLRREARVSADVHHDVGVANAPDQLSFAIGAALSVNGDVAQLAKRELGGGAGESRRKVVGDDDADCHNGERWPALPTESYRISK